MTNKIFTDDELIQITCPNCGYTEEPAITPTISIGFSLDIVIKSVSCSKCGFEGEIEE